MKRIKSKQHNNKGQHNGYEPETVKMYIFLQHIQQIFSPSKLYMRFRDPSNVNAGKRFICPSDAQPRHKLSLHQMW